MLSPLNYVLKVGKKYTFIIKCSDEVVNVVIDDKSGRWNYLYRDDNGNFALVIETNPRPRNLYVLV